MKQKDSIFNGLIEQITLRIEEIQEEIGRREKLNLGVKSLNEMLKKNIDLKKYYENKSK